MKSAPHFILITGITAGLLFGQEPPRPPSPPSPSESSTVPVPNPRPPRPRPEGDRPRSEGERQPREFDRQGPDGERPPPHGARPERPGEDPPFPGEPGHRPPPRERGERGREPRTGQAPRMAEKLQPYLGVITRNAPPELTAQIRQTEGFGLIVEDILPDSPAQAAGLQRNDLLLRFDDQLLAHPIQLEALVRRTGKDKEATLTLLRAGAEQKVTLKVGEKMLPDRRPGPRPGGGPEGLSRPLGPQGGSEAGETRGAYRRPNAQRLPSGGESTSSIASGQVRILRTDSQGAYELSQADGSRNFVVKDTTGKVTWQGPVTTQEQRDAMPVEWREKLKMLEAARPAQQRSLEGRPPVQ